MRLFLAALISSLCYGAANLTISSASLAADGQSMTLVMSAGSLSPSSGLTGCFTMHGGNTNSNGVGSASTSGSDVTFSLNAPMDRVNTVTIDIATVGGGCSLTSSGNTPQGQSGVSVTNGSEWYGCGGAQLAASARYDGGPLLNTDSFGENYPNLCEWNSADGGLTVQATGSAVQVWAFNGTNAYNVMQDGVFVGSRVKTGSSSVFSNISLATGLSGSHQYRVVNSAGSSGFEDVIIALVRFVGGTISGSPPTSLPIIGACGDSIVGSGSAPDDSTTVDWWLDSIAIGTSAQIYTASGSEVVPTLMTVCPTHSIPFGGNTTAIWVLQGGVNDQAAGNTIGNNTTSGTFQGDYVTMIHGLQTDSAPPTVLLVRGILPNTDTNSSNRTLYTAAQSAAVTYINTTYSTHVCYYDTTNWIVPATDTVDGVHPYGATSLAGIGFGKVANNEAPIFAGYLTGTSFSVSGPASGTVGAPSTAFTVTLPYTATFNGVMTITLNDGGNGGTFTPSVGSPGTGPLVVTPTSGATFTFTYTPASSGVKTIGYSGLPNCWTAPASNTYTSFSSASIGSTISGKTAVYGKTVIQ